MNYVITGYTGFLGSALRDAILAANSEDRIYAVCRNRHQGQITFPERVTPVWAEMEEYASLHQSVPHADVFIHCSWAGADHAKRDDKEVHQQNVQYSLDAIRAAAQMGCKVFVETGSQAEYGATNEQQTEDMECKPFSEYGKAKLDMWHQGKQLAEQLGMRYIHLRIFSMYGEKDHPWSMIMQCLQKMQTNERIELSACIQNWNYVYVDDAAKMIIGLCKVYMQQPDIPSGIYNIASEDTRPLKEFVEEMRAITGMQSEIVYGAFKPQVVVALNPSIAKIKRYITPTFILFEEGVKKILNNKEN